MDHMHTAAPPTPAHLRASPPAPARHASYRLVEACVLLVAFLSGAVALAANLVALLGD